jgi:hypothetical protein
MHKDEVRLTDDRQCHIKKRSIPRYNEEYLGNTPILPPHMLDFAVKEDEPVIHLVTDDSMIEKPDPDVASARELESYHECHHRDLRNEGPSMNR